MFTRRSRLSKEEIAEISKVGQSVHTPFFSLKILSNPEKTLENGPRPNDQVLVGQAKFAFVMSKKEERTAPGRNRGKRRLRAAMRKLLPSLSPIKCIVYVKKSVLKAPFNDIVQELKKALHV